MNIEGYDAWKLSNPWDDGHYKEDETPQIEESIYYKHVSDYKRQPAYGMITTSGHDIKIWNWFGIHTINIDPIGTDMKDVDAEIERVKANYDGFEFITREEFLEAFNAAQERINKLVSHETRY